MIKITVDMGDGRIEEYVCHSEHEIAEIRSAIEESLVSELSLCSCDGCEQWFPEKQMVERSSVSYDHHWSPKVCRVDMNCPQCASRL